MCGIKLKDRLPSKELRERLGVDYIALVLQQNRLRWYGHVLRKDDDDWVKKSMEYEVQGASYRKDESRIRMRCATMRGFDTAMHPTPELGTQQVPGEPSGASRIQENLSAAGLRPGPRWWSLQCSHDSIAGGEEASFPNPKNPTPSLALWLRPFVLHP